MTGADLTALIKKNPISVACGFIAVLMAVGIYFRGGQIPEIETALAEKTGQVEQHAANIKNAAQLKEQVDLLAAANKEIDSRIIASSQRALHSQFFSKLAAETGVKATAVQGTTVLNKGKNAFNPINFSVSASGTLPQLIDFLHHLESGERYCRVLTANITTVAGNRSGALTLVLNLEMLGRP